MEKFFLDTDISLCCITASSFPEGVLAAHQQLHSKFINKEERAFFGISRPGGNGKIIYKAAVKLLDNEKPESFGGEKVILKKGEYTSITIKDFRKDIPAIGRAFQQLLSNPAIDPDGYCVEMYTGESDVQCMVRSAQ